MNFLNEILLEKKLFDCNVIRLQCLSEEMFSLGFKIRKEYLSNEKVAIVFVY